MLKELEQGVNKLKLLEGYEVDTDSKKELVTLWNERFQFIQVTLHMYDDKPHVLHVTIFIDLISYHGTCSES